MYTLKIYMWPHGSGSTARPTDLGVEVGDDDAGDLRLVPQQAHERGGRDARVGAAGLSQDHLHGEYRAPVRGEEGRG